MVGGSGFSIVAVFIKCPNSQIFFIFIIIYKLYQYNLAFFISYFMFPNTDFLMLNDLLVRVIEIVNKNSKLL